jgi:aspartate/methionine/tyrosine aminotransferase
MKAIIDRIEDNWIVFESEDGTMFDVPLSYFSEAQEGDHVTLIITKDEESKKEAEERIEELRSKLRRVEL